MEKDNIISKAKKAVLVGLLILKSVWNSTIHVVWGFATIFLLAVLLAYYKVDGSTITTLLEITYMLMNNWVLFWWTFSLYEFLSNIGDIFKKW